MTKLPHMAEIFLIYAMAKIVYSMVKIATTTKLDIVHSLTILTSVKGMWYSDHHIYSEPRSLKLAEMVWDVTADCNVLIMFVMAITAVMAIIAVIPVIAIMTNGYNDVDDQYECDRLITYEFCYIWCISYKFCYKLGHHG